MTQAMDTRPPKRSMGLRLRRFAAAQPELMIVCFIATLALAFAKIDHLPLILPQSEGAATVGVHYLYPLLGVAVLSSVILKNSDFYIRKTAIVGIASYAVVLFFHFNMKLWIPIINNNLYDDFYFRIDGHFTNIVAICEIIREKLRILINYRSNFYVYSYMSMFYISFLYHAMKTRNSFRHLIISVLLVQTLGTIGYISFPAIGPFIYEHGVDPVTTEAQQRMFEFYKLSVQLGPDWLAKNGGVAFVGGLAAMPSLHTALAALFFLFALRCGRVLVPLYSLLLVFILITAIAARWHYLIDLPAGALIAWISYRWGEKLAAMAENAERPHGPAPAAA